MKQIIKFIKQFLCNHDYDRKGTFRSFGGPCPKYAFPVKRSCIKCEKEIFGLWEMRFPNKKKEKESC